MVCRKTQKQEGAEHNQAFPKSRREEGYSLQGRERRPPKLTLESKSKNLCLCPKGMGTTCFMQRGGPIRLRFHRDQSGCQVERRLEGLGQGGGS